MPSASPFCWNIAAYCRNGIIMVLYSGGFCQRFSSSMSVNAGKNFLSLFCTITNLICVWCFSPSSMFKSCSALISCTGAMTCDRNRASIIGSSVSCVLFLRNAAIAPTSCGFDKVEASAKATFGFSVGSGNGSLRYSEAAGGSVRPVSCARCGRSIR